MRGGIDGKGKTEAKKNVGTAIWEVDTGTPGAAEKKEVDPAEADISREAQQNETCGACVDETKGTVDK